ncbi:MAG: DMT family transporter [Caldilineales bacterium]|nr:DMT family transporter [Caldilineales bacterium]
MKIESMPVSERQQVVAAYVALALGILCIGLSAIWVKLANVPGVTSAFYRLAFAAVAVTPLWLSRRSKRVPRAAWGGIALAGVFFALDLALWNTAILMTSAAIATLLANNAPLWVGLGAVVFFRERLSSVYWAGLVTSLVGMALIVLPKAAGGLQLDMGSLLAIATSFFYAAYLLTTKRVRCSTDTMSFMALSLWVGTATLAVLAVAVRAPLIGFPLSSWAALLGLALISQVGGWLAISYAIGHLPASRVSVTLLGQVLVTTVVAALVFGEVPSLLQVVGGALVLAGIYAVLRTTQK